LLKPGTKTSEQSIHIKQIGISQEQGLTLISRFLSILSWCDGVPMENLYGFSGSPVPVPISRDSARVFGLCIVDQYPFYRSVPKTRQARLAIALYREALTVNSTAFSFLSYFKILNIFWKNRREIVAGIKEALPHVKGDLAIHRIKQLGMTEADIAKYLYESGRCRNCPRVFKSSSRSRRRAGPEAKALVISNAT